MKWLSLIILSSVSAVACARMEPLAPSSSTVPAVRPSVRSFVIIGDSVALGEQWAIVQRAITADWTQDAVSGSSLHVQWQPDGLGWQGVQGHLATAPTAFLMHIGANDTVLQTGGYPAPTDASVFADLERLMTAITTSYPHAILYLADVGPNWLHGDYSRANAEVRAGIERAWREIPGIQQGPLMHDLTPDDGVHFTSPQNVQTIADRWIQVLGH